MNQDNTTEFIRRALNILFVSNPKGTSLGILVGVVLHGIFGIFSPILKTFELLNFSSLKLWHFIGLGVTATNIAPYLKRHEVDPTIQSALEYIKQQLAEGNIAEWQAKKMYITLLEKVIATVALEHEAAAQAQKLNSITQPDKEPHN
ncbi:MULTISPECIES: hypothetical protein [unclassified Pseudomonas]|uniref:hypothetical protein n=1 Tax=unclassified Pseudomonas TaxID=196821 RepID=UPI002098010B|nr:MULTISPECIES: hypothetical protein [unclassified Pseudomonas]MCO7519197.1 hypothetical protein [Pseudomonas sp. 1]MCO7540152.1 hypothetical protein [Pseudomonas sp. VA159-2]